MTDKALLQEILQALGGIKVGEGSEEIGNQISSVANIINKLKTIRRELSDAYRVAQAQETKTQRIKPDDPTYGVHMRHCYGLDYDSVYGDEKPTERYSCKYGEDDICPAALFPDPWAEYCRAEDAGEFNNKG